MAKKTIPCRVCGKQFEPCAFCQKNGDTFRWRNFACSLECANKYVAEAIAYRNKKGEEVQPIVEEVAETVEETVIEEVVEVIAEEIAVEELVTEEVPVEETPKKMKKKYYKN